MKTILCLLAIIAAVEANTQPAQQQFSDNLNWQIHLTKKDSLHYTLHATAIIPNGWLLVAGNQTGTIQNAPQFTVLSENAKQEGKLKAMTEPVLLKPLHLIEPIWVYTASGIFTQEITIQTVATKKIKLLVKWTAFNESEEETTERYFDLTFNQ